MRRAAADACGMPGCRDHGGQAGGVVVGWVGWRWWLLKQEMRLLMVAAAMSWKGGLG